jgi:hypothetical protein
VPEELRLLGVAVPTQELKCPNCDSPNKVGFLVLRVRAVVENSGRRNEASSDDEYYMCAEESCNMVSILQQLKREV